MGLRSSMASRDRLRLHSSPLAHLSILDSAHQSEKHVAGTVEKEQKLKEKEKDK